MSDIFQLSALEQAKKLARRELSALELTNLYLERIEALNPQLVAFSHVAYDKARLDAKRWDETYRRHEAKQSVLSGVPIGIKDLSMVRFMPAKMGSRSFQYFIPPFDDPNVSRLRKAGMIIVGKTSTSEFGSTPFSPAKNPFDVTRTPGGSSGGSAVAVAAKMLPIAHAADGGGSIRIPASLCGLIGFKASRGVLHHVTLSDKLKLVTEGPIARNLEDTIAFLQLLAKDPRHFDMPRSQKKSKIVFHTQTPLAITDPEIVEVTRRVAKQLEEDGHILEEKPWPNFTFFEDFLPIWRRTLADIPVLKESSLENLTRLLRTQGKTITRQSLKEHLDRLIPIAEKWWGDDVDFHLSPTLACLAPKIADCHDEDPHVILERMPPMGTYTAHLNVIGNAAITLPVAQSKSGLPIGVQLIAPPGKDAELLRLASSLVDFIFTPR